ncbi:AAA family ATPase [Borreliella burgdorferi]|uniref:AAA family ATPase n=1 Tax=Borreliella burgdorferi TaxID=139 RepID=UPI001C38C474|nr:AAA family ATPase [Borreliella burgdorferi]QXG44525.1 AAA family ATPase [Borreliella burgdorferi]WNY61466.1 AAA family ATPase [Borreliella burgdorferi]WNY62352.1 AAA family ATPase [Borreliella burgdorferi]
MPNEYKDINFENSIKAVSRKIQKDKDLIENEAQTRQNLIDPFLDAMGYDHTDISIVKVEEKADILKDGLKRVDYVIYPTKKDEEPTILIEAKYHNSREKLENHLKQLKPYFENIRSQAKRVEFGILTDGIEYRFYTDLDKDNLLDNEPFMVVNLEKLTSKDFEYLKKFSRNSFSSQFASFNKENTSYKELFLKHKLERVFPNYNFNYVIIDTPPNLDSLLDNALNITNRLIIPIQVERFSVESLSILMKYIEKVSMYLDKDIDISIIENQFMKNRNTFKSIENSIKDKYGKYIKGKVHFYNKVKVFTNNLQEPSVKEPYYQECLEALKNILGI